MAGIKHAEKYPWRFDVTNPRYFFDQPVVIDAALRSTLDAFAKRDPAGPWAWFVQTTRTVSDADFDRLVGKS